MNITELFINRYGVWRNLHLPLNKSGLNVLYGPNEAGKTTLMTFVREMLYGFPPEGFVGDSDGRKHATHEGEMRFTSGDEEYLIRRSSADDQVPGIITRSNGSRVDVAQFQELLGDVDQELFTRVFAVGLRELQELATLDDTKAANRIYDMTLGPRALQLLEIQRECERLQQTLLSSTGESGRLVDLFTERKRLKSELEQLGQRTHQYRELSHGRAAAEDEINNLRERQAGIGHQLRGHLFMERAWSPWKRLDECQAELQSLPVVVGFPEDGLLRMEQFNSEIEKLSDEHNRARVAAKTAREEAEQFTLDPELVKYEPSLRSFIDQRDWILELQTQVEERKPEILALKKERDTAFANLPSALESENLHHVDTSPATHGRLVNAARSFRKVISRRARLKQSVKKIAATCEKRDTQLSRLLAQFETDSIQDALDLAQQRLSQLENLGDLKLKELALHHQSLGIDRQRERLSSRMSPPTWFYVTLGIMTLCGLVSLGSGIYNGAFHQWLASGTFALFGVMLLALGRLAKQHFEHGAESWVEALDQEQLEVQSELRSVRDDILLLTEETSSAEPSEVTSDETHLEAAAQNEADAIRRCIRQLAELESSRRLEQKQLRDKKRLQQKKDLLYETQREVAAARQNWNQLLNTIGLPQIPKISLALEMWQRAVITAEASRRHEAALKDCNGRQQLLDSFCRRMKDVGRQMQPDSQVSDDPIRLIDDWESQLKTLSFNRKRLQELIQQAHDHTHEANTVQAETDGLKMKRDALLIQGGASDQEDFENRAHACSRRSLLERQQDQLQQDLELVASSEPELAIAEEDMRLFDAHQNTECIELLRMEQEDLADDLQRAFEHLGAAKRELDVLEADRTSNQIRWKMARVQRQICSAGSEWFALERSRTAIRRMCRDIERTHQPVALAEASRHLSRITDGRYGSIWTPLGKRELRIDERDGNNLPIEQLSQGTREQLFLAVRLALVQESAHEGAALPMVLDDVFVNFDERRSEAAAEMLLEFADQGRQVLFFTCHLHLARLFQSKGCEPIWLPDHGSQEPLHYEERRAG